MTKKVKWDLPKVKCFNYDNHKHLAKNCPKPPKVSDYISEGKFIFQGGFVANKSKTSNLLKLKCKINDKLVCYFLYSIVMNSFMTSQVMECWESRLN
jgi:hypothetical protein